MGHARSLVIAVVLAAASGLVSGCSSTSKPAPGPAQTSSVSTSGSSSVAASETAVQTYLDAVNILCDALLPKVIAVTNGGSLDIPLKDFFAQLPAHTMLLTDFDQALAQVPVPPDAKAKADALAAYIRFANQLDAKRLAAANQGAAAYAKEIKAESASAENDPSIAARNAAGFNSSCDAR